MTSIYHVSKHSSSQYDTLIDGGPMEDLQVLMYISGRTVSVTAIGNHELPGLKIVTCAGLINTNHGKVVTSCMNMHIMAQAIPFIPLVKLNDSRTSVMTNLSMWVANKLSLFLMDMPLLYSVDDTILDKAVVSLLPCSVDSWEFKTTKDIEQHNNQTIATKNTLEVFFSASDNTPHHYPKF